MLLTKLVLGLASALLSAWALHAPVLDRVSPRRAQRALWWIMLPAYLACAAALHALRGARDLSDASGYYYPAALSALRGELVYRDFSSSYAPLFSYLAAACVALWNDPRVFSIIAVTLHALTLSLWLRAGHGRVEQATWHRAAAVFALSAHGLINVMVGQNQVWLAALIAASFALSKRPLVAGIALGAGLSCVKLLAIVFAAPLWPAARHRGVWAAGALCVTAIVYGGFAWLGADVTAPLAKEGSLTTSGNLPYVLSALGFDPSGPSGTACLLIGLALGLYTLGLGLTDQARAPERTLARCAVALLVLMLFSRKAFTTYLVLGLFPLCWVAAASRARSAKAAFLAVTVLAPLEPSLWFRWLQQRDLSVLWTATDPLRASVFLSVEFALISAYAVLLWHAFVLAQPEQRSSTA